MPLDPVTLAILKGRLEQIADEMDATLFRSAFNPIHSVSPTYSPTHASGRHRAASPASLGSASPRRPRQCAAR